MMTCTSLLLPGSTMPLLGRTQYFLGLVVFTCTGKRQRAERFVPREAPLADTGLSSTQSAAGASAFEAGAHLEGHALPSGILQRKRARHILAQLKAAGGQCTAGRARGQQMLGLTGGDSAAAHATAGLATQMA